MDAATLLYAWANLHFRQWTMTIKGRNITHTPRTVLGFNGELFEPTTGHCLLGNGYRAYSPLLMIFIQPDSWSPFGAGGLNAYAYCKGDPVNYCDPTGHAGWLFAWKRARANPAQRLKASVVVGGGERGLKRTHDQAFEPSDQPLDPNRSTGTLPSSGAIASTSVDRPLAPSPRPSAEHPASAIESSLLDAAREVPLPRDRMHHLDAALETEKKLVAAISGRDATAFNTYSQMKGNGAYSGRLLHALMPDTRRPASKWYKFNISDRDAVLAQTDELALKEFLVGIQDSIRKWR